MDLHIFLRTLDYTHLIISKFSSFYLVNFAMAIFKQGIVSAM
ncbi:hypothetical protein UNSWCS_1945 [Campylobacter concisus UNSWCS]|uniref:Uncharacterized protein n=1 Tax=Campylobacter concisus UNSWCS TaxID=1242968 RepID=U2FJ59_9BACT|nr:hypothetical protein [Campylobacter concisus]ERJ30355.1 hypothetical protein UNSWCS_1945 [Campylobacter concisus UNSWCS]